MYRLSAGASAITLCLFSFISHAQEAQQQLQALLKGLSTYQAEFVQTVTDAEGQVLQSAEGVLELKQPNKLYWKLLPPNESALVADGNTLWHVDPFVEQVVAINQSDAIQNNPMVLLSDPDSDKWNTFTISQSNGNYFVHSQTDDSQIVSLSLSFEKETLIALSMEDRQQQVSSLVFSKIKQNKKLKDDNFRFTLPTGFDLDDQRQ